MNLAVSETVGFGAADGGPCFEECGLGLWSDAVGDADWEKGIRQKKEEGSFGGNGDDDGKEEVAWR